jgi:tetratricopeptide (TPR) repeat protein
MATNWQIGERIDNRWEVHKILRGAMGIVYIVYDHESREAYAAKTFQDEILDDNPAIADRFLVEARTWVNLDRHPNIAEARFVERIEGKPFVFLEYVTGGDLGLWIGTRRLTEDVPQILRFSIQFCDGMIHARLRGIEAHRDIKPENCLMSEDETLKITDFGIAKVFDEATADPRGREAAAEAEPRVSSLLGSLLRGRHPGSDPGAVKPPVRPLELGLTGTGIAAGTCTYMSPEQFEDTKRVDVRADVYSFGVMLFEMVSGRLPFEGQSWSDYERLHKSQPAPPLQSDSASLNAVVQTCLAKSPSDRFADFTALRARLTEIYQRLTGTPARKAATGLELDASAWSNKGMSLANLGRHEEALLCFESAIEIDQKHATSWTNRAVALQALGRRQEALQSCEAAVQADPSHWMAWCNHGVVLAEMRRFEEALTCYARAVALSPRNWSAWANQGAALADLGRHHEALPCYDQALELNPRHWIAWANKASALSRLGRPDEQLGCLDRAIEISPREAALWSSKGGALTELKRYEEALACFDRALSLSPDLLDAWAGKARALREQARHEEAITCYDRMIELDPHSHDGWLKRGTALARLGRNDEGLASIDRALELSPGEAELWSRKGAILTRLGRHEEALGCYTHLLQLNPRSATYWALKAEAFGNLDRHNEELACYDEALALNAEYAEAWFNKGVALLKYFDRYDQALVCFEQAERLGVAEAAETIALCRKRMQAPDRTPGAQVGRQDEAFVRGVECAQSQQWAEALSYFERALELAPTPEDDRKPPESRALAQKALACYNLASHTHPRDEAVWHARGVLLALLGRHREALISYNHALDLNPLAPRIWSRKGLALMQLERLGEALTCLREAQRLGEAGAAHLIDRCRRLSGK